MNIQNAQIDKLVDNIPNDDERKQYYVEKIKRYSNECGCSWGAIGMIMSLGAFIIYCFFILDLAHAGFLKTSFLGVAYIFGAGLIGKLMGIARARIKLALLYKKLKNKLTL